MSQEENALAVTPATIEFNADALAPVAMFTPKHDIRFYLNGVCVMPHHSGVGCVIVGTDGHRLAMWYDDKGVCRQQVILTVSDGLIEASRGKGGYGLNRKVQMRDGRLCVIDEAGLEIFVQPGEPEILNGKYPDVFKVISDLGEFRPGAFGVIASKYVQQLGKVGRLLNGKKLPCHITNFTAKQAVLTRFPEFGNFIVITMTVADSTLDTNTALPDCFNVKKWANEQLATSNFPTGSMGEEVAA